MAETFSVCGSTRCNVNHFFEVDGRRPCCTCWAPGASIYILVTDGESEAEAVFLEHLITTPSYSSTVNERALMPSVAARFPVSPAISVRGPELRIVPAPGEPDSALKHAGRAVCRRLCSCCRRCPRPRR
jgi:hypothetical protein